MNVVIEKVILLAVLLLPFIQSFKIIDIFVPFQTLSFDVLLLGTIIWMIKVVLYKKIYVPDYKFSMLLLGFLVAITFSGIANFSSLLNMKYQATLGINRFVMEYVLFIVYVMILYFIYDTLCQNDDMMKRIHKYILYSFFIAGGYGVIELAMYFGNSMALDIINVLDHFFRGEANEGNLLDWFRIRSVTKEPSNFAVYSAVILPWLYSTVFVSKKRIGIILGIIIFIVLNLFSYSRTGYVVLTIETIVFFRMFHVWLKMSKSIKFLLILLVSAILSICLLDSTIFDSIDVSRVFVSLLDSNNISNIGRFSAQVAAVNIFNVYPLFGCGFGMYPFYVSDYYPDWAWFSPEVQTWGSNYTDKISWAPAFNFWLRLLAETGLAGTIFFGALWFYVIYRLMHIRKHCRGELLLFSNCLIVSLSATVLLFVNGSDMLIIEWILIPIALYVIRKGETYDS